MAKKSLTDKEIEDLYDSGEFKLSQEKNDFLLPQVGDFIETKKWINTRPEYQRRLVWDNKKKSKFIESLLMNIPIPPIFLYEWDLNRYEVMDGQQRLNAVVDFYNNRYKLSGLEQWSALNGMSYSDCPLRIQRGLDRRRISATVLLAESAREESDKQKLRKFVFERLNTGGIQLNPQELRNCLYASEFNAMLTRLAGNPLFNDIWDIPRYEDYDRGGKINVKLASNALFKRMKDVEIVLRFFAFRRKSSIRGSVRKVLDTQMDSTVALERSQVDKLAMDYNSRLKLAYEIFKESTFRLPNNKTSIPLYDAVMVALDRCFDKRIELVKARSQIRKSMKAALSDDETYELVVGRANTAQGIKDRIDFVEKLFREAI